MRFLVLICSITTFVAGHIINGRGSVQKQLFARDDPVVASIFDNLSYQDQDYINSHLSNLTSFNASKCETCKNKIKYARRLIDEDPDNKHLIALTLFKYCLKTNKNHLSKCDATDFFVTTHDTEKELPSDYYDLGYGTETSINFFDNDFLHMVANFNLSSKQDLEYYCYYKESHACPLPETIDIDELYDFDAKWPSKQPKHYFEPVYNVSREKLSLFNVLHITDFHTQLRYKVGSEANCSQGLCCLPESFNKDLPKTKYHNFSDEYHRIDNNLTNLSYSFYPDAEYVDGKYKKGKYYHFTKARGYDSVSLPANTFGAYACDAPEVLVNNTLIYIQHFNLSKKFEFSLFTGDLVDHDVSHCTPEVTLQAETLGFRLMKQYLNHIPIFPCLGNHDTFPYGQLVPLKFEPNSTYQYNTKTMSDLWINDGWLPKNVSHQLNTHYTGFSTVTRRGLKVISLNSNAYYQKNLWAYIDLINDPDKYGQWQFLIDELTSSEAIGQRVWIMAHIPSSDYDALPIQSRIFAKIVERFSPYTIANIFYGHTHKDQFKVFYSSNSTSAEQVEKEVVNMAWIAQSVTPIDNLNPSFKYYEVEDKSFNIRNAYSYYARLNETFVNGGNEPRWEFEYSARKTYDPEGSWAKSDPLNATFWNEFVLLKIFNQSNIEFNQKYIDLQYRNTPYVPNCANGTNISDVCYSSNFCEAGSDLSENYIKCSA